MNIQDDFLLLKDSLASYLYRLTTHKEDTEDLVQDTYLRVAEKKDTFKGNSSFKTWVFAIATNLAKDKKKVQNRWRLDAQDSCKTAAMNSQDHQKKMFTAFGSQAISNFEIAEHINYCFTCVAKNLSLEKQLAIILKEIYDFKRTEIAEILNITEGVVKHLLHDGRNELQEKYNHRCAMINKKGICFQCAELNDTLEGKKSSTEKISKLGLTSENSDEANLERRFEIIKKINPLNSNGAAFEDTLMQILRETILE